VPSYGFTDHGFVHINSDDYDLPVCQWVEQTLISHTLELQMWVS